MNKRLLALTSPGSFLFNVLPNESPGYIGPKNNSVFFTDYVDSASDNLLLFIKTAGSGLSFYQELQYTFKTSAGTALGINVFKLKV